MGTGYTRNDTDNNIADGNVINAADFDGEFDAIVTAFSTSGHTHDGTSAEGGPVTVLGPAQDFVVSATTVTPKTTNTLDLGTSSLLFKDAFFDGDITTGGLIIDNAGSIGSASDTNAITISSGGVVAVTATTASSSATTGALTVAGGAGVAADLSVGDDLRLISDSSVLSFGADSDTTLTHTDGTGLTLNSTNKLTFGDAASFVQQSSNGVLRIDGEATIDLNASTAVTVSNDLKLDSDAAVLGFGADNDVTLTHVADTGLLLNSTMALQFNDSSQFINAPSATVLDINATDEIELNATLVDINANVEVSGTLTVAGAVDFGDAALSNVGAVQLDSIAGDGDTNTSITFSGSDVITVATGGSTAMTVDANQDVNLTNDLHLKHDAAVLNFGADNDVTLTHVADTGLLLNSTSVIQFNDASQKIGAPNATTLDIDATDEIELNATLVDVNANLDVSGTYTGAGLMTTGGNIVIPDAGNIGSASDTDAIAIASDGVVTLTQKLIGTELDISGNIDVDGTTNLDVVDIDGAVDMASTLQLDGAITLGVAGASNGFINSPSGIFVNIDSDNNQTDRFFDIRKDSTDGSGTLLFQVLESGAATFSGAVTADSGISIDNITIDGTEIDLSSGSLTIDVAGNIVLDADGGEVQFKDGGTEYVQLKKSGNDVQITAGIQDGDIVFRGNDGGGMIAALTLDISESGDAAFNRNVGAGITPIERLHSAGAIASTGSSSTGSTSGAERAILDLTSNAARIGHFRGSTSAGSGSLELYTDSSKRLTIDSSGNVGIANGDLTITSTDAASTTAGPVLTLARDGASPEDNDLMGQIVFKMDDDAGNLSTFAKMEVVATDVSNGSEDARIDFIAAKDDSFSAGLSIAGQNVGIGTTSPDGLLHLFEGSDTGGTAHADADTLILENDGNSGLSIISSTSGKGTINFDDAGGNARGSIVFDHSTDDMTIEAEDDLRLYAKEDVVMRGTTYTFDSEGGTTEFMKINTDGKLLIGNSTSQTTDLLQVESPASGGGHGIAIRRNDNNTDQQLGRIMFGNTVDSDIGQIHVKTDGATNTGAMIFSTALSGTTTEAMRIDSSGNIIAKLGEVQVSPASGTAKLRLTSQGSGSEVFSVCGQIPGTSNTGFSIRNETDSRNDLVIDGSGNVGIGATSPLSLLDLTKTTTGNITSGSGNKGAVLTLHHEAQWENGYTGGDWLGALDFSTGDASAGEGIRASIRTTVDTYFNTNSLVFYTCNQGDATLDERMRIDQNGRVGITAAPEFSSTFSALELGTTALVTPSNTNGRLVTNLYYDGAYKRKHEGASLQYEQDAAGHIWYYDSSASADSSFTQTEMLRLDTSGNLDLHLGNFVVGTSGKGIDFSAGAGGNSTSNLLDEYEEGTFTIGLKDSGGSAMGVNNSTGRYTKIGRVVTVEAEVTRNDTQSLTGNLTLTGLPFTSLNANSINSAIGQGKFWVDEGGPSTNNGDTVCIPTMNANSTEVIGVRTTSSGAETSERYAQTDELTNGRFVYLSIVYVAA